MGGTAQGQTMYVGQSVDVAQDGMPKIESDRVAIRGQLEQILAHTTFQTSKRYPAFLRYVVENTLEGRAEQLKERSIGIEVFGRQPDYDTNLDHRVRTVAGEVRKRLAQYYVEPGRENGIRIDLPPGSYVPQFRRPAATEPRLAGLIVQDEEAITIPLEPAPSAVRRFGWARLTVPAAVVCLILAATGVTWIHARTATVSMAEQFWSPVTASSNPVTFCLGAPATLPGHHDNILSPTPAVTLSELHSKFEKVPFADAVTVARLSGLLEARQKNFRVVYSPLITLADLRQGPTILIGAFDNDWTLLLAGPLRYSFHRDGDATFTRLWIVDVQHPERQDWAIDWTMPYLQLSKDYAIISRVVDPTTGEIVIVVAGITKYGTLAAGEFLTSSRMNELQPHAPRDWRHKNVQIVLSTNVVKGSAGPPHLEAVYFW